MLGHDSRPSMSLSHLALFQLFILSFSMVSMLTPTQGYNVDGNYTGARARALRVDLGSTMLTMSSEIASNSPLTTYRSYMLAVSSGATMSTMRATKRNLLTIRCHWSVRPSLGRSLRHWPESFMTLWHHGRACLATPSHFSGMMAMMPKTLSAKKGEATRRHARVTSRDIRVLHLLTCRSDFYVKGLKWQTHRT